jgi:hypothetical protein
MKIQTKRIREIIVPTKLIFKKQYHEITNISRKFVIRDYKIKTVDDKIDTVTLNNPHPNADPQTGEFCIPHKIRELEVNEKSLNFIRVMLCSFNLDDCYFTPWDEIEYKNMR